MSTQTAPRSADLTRHRSWARSTRTGIVGRVATAVAWVVVIVSASAPIVYLAIVSVSPRSDVLGGGILPSRLAVEN